MSSFAPFPWLPAVEPGVYGAFYELRGYELKPGGLPHTLEAWKEALPERQQISPCLVALHSLDGVPRIVHIWPAPSLEARSAARAAAVKSGVWPPRNGPAWLKSSMQSDILVPAAFSPLR